MASSQPVQYATNRLAVPQFYGNSFGGNALAGGSNFAPPQPAASVDVSTPAANLNLPSWLTDITARGLGNDWTPTQGAAPAPYVFNPRDIPQDVVQPTPAQQTAPAQVQQDVGLIQQPRSGGEGSGPSNGAGNGYAGDSPGYAGYGVDPSQGQYNARGDFMGVGPNAASNSGGSIGVPGSGSLAGLGDPFGGRAPTANDLGIAGRAAFGAGTAMAGPVGMVASGINTALGAYNTAMNYKALDVLGTPMSTMQTVGGVLGAPNYSGSLATAIGSMMAHNPDYAATQSSQQPGPTAAQVAAANVANPTNPIDPTVAVTQEPLAAPTAPAPPSPTPETAADSQGFGGFNGNVDQANQASNNSGVGGTATSNGSGVGDITGGGFGGGDNTGGSSGGGGGGGGGEGGGGNGGANNGGGGNGANAGGQGGGAGDGMGGGGGFGGRDNFKGGPLTQNRLIGPNPPGPDTGFASVQAGEGVLTKAAMQHYGPAFLARLNKLAVPKR
jgi:hypothetical protein